MRLLLISTRDGDPLVAMLLDHGHEVVTAENGEIGLVTFCRAAIDGAPFEAVVADLGLPNLDGAKVIDRILAIAPATVTVLLTGWGETGHGCRSVAKPVRFEELRRALGVQ